MYLGSVAAPPVIAPAEPEVGTVAYEALRLDRLFPGWYVKIDTDSLVMMDGFKCVLGQGVCNFDMGSGDFFCYGSASRVVAEDLKAMGQSAGDILPNYLSQSTVPAWTREIERRRRS